MVLVDREVAGVEADFIESNHEEGGYLATRYLVELGHRRIACVSGPDHLQPSRDRVAGYRRALAEAGIEHDPAYLLATAISPAKGDSLPSASCWRWRRRPRRFSPATT